MYEKLISELINFGLATKEDIQGCTINEVSNLEAKYGNLPDSYRGFLLELGKGAGELMQGTDIFNRCLNDLNIDAIELLEENEEEFELPGDAFVFSMHQGYEFLYFNLSDGDNPVVYQYVEGEGAPTMEWNSFSEFIYESLNQHIKQRKRK